MSASFNGVLNIPHPTGQFSGLTRSRADEETAITDVEFTPDGLILVFGASREILELLDSLGLGDSSLSARLYSSPESDSKRPAESGQ